MLHPIHFRQYLDIMNSLGFTQADILADSGITAEAMDDPEYCVSFDQYLRLFKNMGRFGDYPGLGLEIGLRSELLDAGILSHASLSCNSVRQAIEELWSRYGRRLGMIACPYISHEGPELVTIEIAIPFLNTAARRIILESILCRIAKYGNGSLLKPDWPVFRHIFFPFPAPEYHDMYSRIFQCPISFNSPRARVIVMRSWLEQPLKTQDEELFRYYRHNLMQLDQRLQCTSSYADRVKEQLLMFESAGLPSRIDIAHKLGLSTRTLSRFLNSEGTSYRALVDEVRFGRALMSVESDRTVTKGIAFYAGYRDVNAFRRAFKKWTNKTVRQYCGPNEQEH